MGTKKFFLSQNSHTGNKKSILNMNKFRKSKVLVLDFLETMLENYTYCKTKKLTEVSKKYYVY